MSFWTEQSTRIQAQTAFLLAIENYLTGVPQQNLLAALRGENDELLLLTESPDTLIYRQNVLDSHQRELSGVLMTQEIQALQDLQFNGVEYDLDTFKMTMFGKNLLITP